MWFDETKELILLLLGAGLTSIGFIYQKAAERKRLVNRAIFNCLSIWYICKYAQTVLSDQFWGEYRRALRRIGGRGAVSVAGTEFASDSAKSMRVQIVHQLHEKGLGELDEPFTDSVKEIAELYPLEAYRMYSSIDINGSLELVGGMVRESLQALEGDDEEEVDRSLSDVFDGLRTVINRQMVDNVANQIRFLAAKTSFINGFKVRRYIKAKGRELDESLTDLAERTARMTVEALVEHLVPRKIEEGLVRLSENRMRQLVLMCVRYSCSHAQRWPNSLLDAVEFIEDADDRADILKCVSGEGNMVSYLYVRPSPSVKSMQPVVVENPLCQDGERILVCFADGHVGHYEGEAIDRIWLKARELSDIAFQDVSAAGIEFDQWGDACS